MKPLRRWRQPQAVIASTLFSLCVYFGLSQTQVGSRTVLAFLTPQGWSLSRLREDEQKELAGWLAPAEVGGLSLLSADLPESISAYLQTRADLKGLHPDAAALVEQGRLQVKILNPFLLEILVWERNLKLAQAYSFGTVAHLRQSLEQLRKAKESNPQLDGDVVQAEEQVAQIEAKLNRMVWSNDSPVLQHLSFDHYLEAIQQRRLADARRESWKAGVDGNSPEFVVVANPTQITQPGWLSKPAAALAALAILAGAVLVQQWRARP